MRCPDVHVDAPLVARLIAAQFPQWAGLAVTPVEAGGWDNRTFHLGDAMSVRLPSAAAYAAQVEKEQRWLPKLAPHLPLPIPAPLAMGRPSEEFPWHWSVYRWLEGESAKSARFDDRRAFAVELARFLLALQRIDAADGPAPGAHNFFRGGPPSIYDGETRAAIAALGGLIDAAAAAEVWDAALAATWGGAPVWLHGDVEAGNLLVRDGRLSAVIDFGSSGVGDPACDLSIAWTLFDGESRAAFREALGADRAMWARARGWTLWKATITLAQQQSDSPAGAKLRRVIEQVVGDHGSIR
jgi:aminoglycoside phosphotransferase (APT) family kinase protein